MQEVNDAVEMREKSVPLYYQVETILRKKILMGEFPVGKPLPSEESLAKAYDVSRITIRTALLNLQKEGLIFRKRGKGTFVSKNLSDLESPEYSGFIEDLIYMGIVTDIKLVKSDWVKPDEEIKKALRIDHSKEVLRVEKIRLVDGKPFSHVLNFLPLRIGREIDINKIDKRSMLSLLEEDLGIKVGGAVQTIEADIADAEVAILLNIRVGDPLLKIKRIVFDINKRPVEYVVVLYRADRYFFTVELRRREKGNLRIWEKA